MRALCSILNSAYYDNNYANIFDADLAGRYHLQYKRNVPKKQFGHARLNNFLFMVATNNQFCYSGGRYIYAPFTIYDSTKKCKYIDIIAMEPHDN